MSLRPVLRCLPLVAQLLLILTAVPMLAFYPPAQGAMLLVPLSAQAQAAMLPAVIARGGRLMAPGPVAGSIVVWGQRDALSLPLLGESVLVLAADSAGCAREAQA